MNRFCLSIIFFCWLFALAAAPASAAEEAGMPSAAVLTGTALYEDYCAKCHRPLAKTTKAQRSASRLGSSIERFPAMKKLDFLTEEQLEAIAAALATIPL